MLCVIVIVDGGWWVREPVIATLIRESYLGKCSHFCVVKMSEEVQVSYRVLRCINIKYCKIRYLEGCYYC